MKEYQIGNVVVCITRPTLSEKDRKTREARIANALQQYGKAVEKAVRT